MYDTSWEGVCVVMMMMMIMTVDLVDPRTVHRRLQRFEFVVVVVVVVPQFRSFLLVVVVVVVNLGSSTTL